MQQTHLPGLHILPYSMKAAYSDTDHGTPDIHNRCKSQSEQALRETGFLEVVRRTIAPSSQLSQPSESADLFDRAEVCALKSRLGKRSRRHPIIPYV